MSKTFCEYALESFCRDYSIWHVRHRLKRSWRSFTSKDEAESYYESIKHCKTRSIRELRPPNELVREALWAPNPILQALLRIGERHE